METRNPERDSKTLIPGLGGGGGGRAGAHAGTTPSPVWFRILVKCFRGSCSGYMHDSWALQESPVAFLDFMIVCEDAAKLTDAYHKITMST